MCSKEGSTDSTIRQRIEAAVTARDLPALIREIPYANFLGITCYSLGEEYVYKLPKNESNLGNPTLPALHGGVIGGFMETAGALHTMIYADSLRVPKVVDFSLDYLSPGRHCDTFAKCSFVRQGRKVVNIAISAWQTQESKPIAKARAQFLMV